MNTNLVAKLFSLGIFAIAVISPAHADPGRGAATLCYVWANQPTTASYTPSNVYSYNLVGRANANRISRSSAGVYAVRCNGVGGGSLFSGSGTWGAGGHVQVTAYGGNSNHCKVASWSTGGRDFISNVRCFNSNGQLADSPFTLLFTW
jgi:hypothetical protein